MRDPWSAGAPDSSAAALPNAIGWIEYLLIGRVGTALAVLAVAWVGFALLHGRLPIRDAIRVVFGCFILFGDPIIAQGFLNAIREGEGISSHHALPQTTPAASDTKSPPDFDPYAGASMPTRQ